MWFENHIDEHVTLSNTETYALWVQINAAEATKNIYCAKCEGTIDHRTVTRQFKKVATTSMTRKDQIDLKPLIPRPCSKPYRKSTRKVQYLTLQCDLSHSWPRQKHLEVLNCTVCYQNIAKHLTHPSILVRKKQYCYCFHRQLWSSSSSSPWRAASTDIPDPLSLHVSLSFIASGRSSGLHPVSSHSCCMNVRAGRPAFDWPYAGVHRSTAYLEE